MRSLSQSASKLPAVKVGGLKKNSAAWPWPHSNQLARVRVGPESNHFQSLLAGKFAALLSTDFKFLALKDPNNFESLSKFQETSSILRVGFALSK